MNKKELGQFFSGELVGDLLVSTIPLHRCNLKCIDPMAGKGDLLNSLNKIGVPSKNLFGIEIDKEVVSLFQNNLPDANIYNGDCFDLSNVGLYMSTAWDVVISNPPYVRRELIDRMYSKNGAAKQIRAKLLEILQTMNSHACYIKAAKAYSGLADFAVPAWILCAALVKPGGYLALVVPDVWLTRGYAEPIRGLLKEEFDLECIIRDANSTWFVDAEVKTNLIVAKKAKETGTFRLLELGKSSSSEHSLVGRLQYKNLFGYDGFEAVLHASDDIRTSQYNAMSCSTKALLKYDAPSFILGSDITNIISSGVSIDAWCIHVGQGLRTGSNDFFYFGPENGRYNSKIGKISGEVGFSDLNPAYFMRAFRRQSDAHSMSVIEASKLNDRLLYLCRPIDKLNDPDFANRMLSIVRWAEKHSIKTRSGDKLIPTMSAVRANGPTTEVNADKYWYMLPTLQRRHVPDLAMPRIVNTLPAIYVMPADVKVVVDANFSSIWLDSDAQLDRFGAGALLSSLAVNLQLEAGCTILGGGALKIESRDFKFLKLPEPSKELIKNLNNLGRDLFAHNSDKSRILRSVDEVVIAGFGVHNKDRVISIMEIEINYRRKLRCKR